MPTFLFFSLNFVRICSVVVKESLPRFLISRFISFYISRCILHKLVEKSLFHVAGTQDLVTGYNICGESKFLVKIFILPLNYWNCIY